MSILARSIEMRQVPVEKETVCSSTMNRAFQRFADRLTESANRDSAQQSMTDIAAAMNLSTFAYLAQLASRVVFPS